MKTHREADKGFKSKIATQTQNDGSSDLIPLKENEICWVRHPLLNR